MKSLLQKWQSKWSLQKSGAQITRLLKQPYPYSANSFDHLKTSAAIALFLFLFFVLFRPFGLDQARTGPLLQFSSLNALVSFGISSLIVMLGARLFPKRFNQDNWRVVDEIVITIVILSSLGLGISCLIVYMQDGAVSVSGILKVYGTIQYRVLLVGLFPIAALYFFTQYSLLKQRSALANSLNQQLSRVQARPDQSIHRKPGRIVLSSETGQESLSVAPQDLLFVTSANNYVYVYYREQNEVKTVLLRNKLKEIEARVRSIPFLFRCHRTCIVNVRNIKSVEGNSQGYRLIFDNIDKKVPVARGKTKKLKVLLQSLG